MNTKLFRKLPPMRLLLCTGLVAFSGMAIGGCQTESNPKTEKPRVESLPTVATIRAVKKGIVQKTEQPGRIEAFVVTPIYAKQGGFLEKLMVDIGDSVHGPKRNDKGEYVEAGDLLALLVDPELEERLLQQEALVQQTRAEVRQSEAAIAVAETAARSFQSQIEESQAGRSRAEAAYQRFLSESSRIDRLVATQTLHQKLADEATEQLKAADASRKEASARVDVMTAKQREAEIAIVKTKADLEAAKAKQRVAEAEQARIQKLHDYLEIRSPIDGVVTERNVDLGVLVQAAKDPSEKPMFVVMQADVVRLSVEVPEMDASLIQLKSKANVRVPALGQALIQGEVARTSWALHQSTRTLKCELDIANQDGRLRPGMYAQLELIVAEKKEAWVVPKSTIVSSEGQSYCLAINDDGSLVRKLVQTGIKNASETEIVAGLDGNELLVAANVAAYQEGQKVQVVSKQ